MFLVEEVKEEEVIGMEVEVWEIGRYIVLGLSEVGFKIRESFSCDEVICIGFVFFLIVNKIKLDKLYEVIVFNYWLIGGVRV